MEIISIINNDELLREYINLCSLEWGKNKTDEEMAEYIEEKLKKLHTGDKVISILALMNDDNMIGFISLFKYDGPEHMELTPWYATMFVKKEYRGHGYSKLLNDAIIKEASELGYNKIYLKSDLVNYYEKFGAKYIEKLNNGENLYYIELNNK